MGLIPILRTNRQVLRMAISYARLCIVAMILLYPALWAISTAFKSPAEYALHSLSLLPRNPTLENFSEAWTRGELQLYTMNSLFVAIPTVFMGMVVSVLAGYALAYLKLSFRYIIYIFIVAGLALPLELLIIPLFVQMRVWGLYNTFWAVIFPTVGLMIPFGTLLMRNFFLDFPFELLDAAKIDGCNESQVLWHVVIPNMMPGVSALAVFLFLQSWNMFLLPVVMITETSKRTITTGLANFAGQYTLSIPWLMAGAVIASMPVIIIYAIFQRHFVQGLVTGSMGG